MLSNTISAVKKQNKNVQYLARKMEAKGPVGLLQDHGLHLFAVK